MTLFAAGSRAPQNEISHMRDAVFFEGAGRDQKLSRFWLLVALASVIATAGVVGNSDATVIGAMIVAPLMTPILGVMLSVVLVDWPNLVRSIALVLAGAVSAVAIAISLVPPLTVAGLTLEARQPGQAGGALLLFLTNVLSILVAGVIVMGLYRVHRRTAVDGPTDGASGEPTQRRACDRGAGSSRRGSVDADVDQPQP